MINTISENPLFGFSLTLLVFLLSVRLFRAYPHPWTNPLLISTVVIILILKFSRISYENYFRGGAIINDMIAPSTVALAIPLYRSFHLLKHHARSIIISISITTLINTLLTALLAKFFGLPKIVVISIFPKSVTTAMAIGISQKMGGVMEITVVVVVATGILTSVLGIPILNLFQIKDPVAQGIALGGTGHAIGTGNAIELGPTQGAMAALAIGVTGIMYVICVPIMAKIILGV